MLTLTTSIGVNISDKDLERFKTFIGSRGSEIWSPSLGKSVDVSDSA